MSAKNFGNKINTNGFKQNPKNAIHKGQPKRTFSVVNEELKAKGVKFEYWGGEPFVYWKTFKPLAEAIIKQYPNAEHSVITNGSLLDLEKIMWLDQHSFSVGISHDGPGQHVRGPDPLADNSSRMAVVALYKLLAPKHKVSFNVMMNSKNTSRAAIADYFEEFIRTNLGEEYLQYLVICEGMFVDAYD